MNDRQMSEAEIELAKLTGKQLRPPLKFAFTEIGEQIIASLVKAADDQVKEAENLRVEVMQLATSISEQLKAQAEALAAMHERTKAFGQEVLDAHKKFINGDKHENPPS